MTAKVFVVTTDDKTIQIGGTWMSIGDAASDINGGDFWREARKHITKGAQITQIRIVPDEPLGDG